MTKKINQKKAQSSVELVIMVCFVTLTLLVSLSILHFYAFDSTDKIIAEDVNRIATSFVKNVEFVKILGYPARRVVQYNFPINIFNMSVDGNKLIVFDVQYNTGRQESVYYSDINISSNFTEIDFSEGPKEFLFEVSKDNSNVSITRWYS